MELVHHRLVSDLSSSDPAKRIAGLSTVIQLANAGHDVSEYAPTVLEKGFQAKQSPPLARRLSYHLLTLMHLSPKDREVVTGIIKADLSCTDAEVVTGALRLLTQIPDEYLLHMWPDLQVNFEGCLLHRSYKVRETAVLVARAHIRSMPNRRTGLAVYRDTVIKMLHDPNAEVANAAFTVLQELIVPNAPLYYYQEPEQPLYCAAAADSFAEEVVWFSGIMGRLPQYCRARALRPLTLLYLHLESVPHTERFRQSTARDFLANQLLPLLQCTGAADVALEACHCALLICAHVLHRTHNSDPRLAPQWVAHAVWRAAHSLLLILNGTLSMELGSLAPHVVLELACVLRLMADPDHVHSVCAQMLHYVPQLADALQREVITLCMRRLVESYELRGVRALRRKAALSPAALVPLATIGWWQLVMSGESNTHDALREHALFVMLTHLYGLVGRLPASAPATKAAEALPRLAVAAQVTSICSECLEWGYTKTRQYVVMSAYLKLVLHLISELHVWRHVRADEEVERHVSQSLQEVYIAVQQTLVALTQSTGTPLPTAVKGVLHCLLLSWTQTKKGEQSHEIFTNAVEFLGNFMEKVRFSAASEPTAAMMVTHLLSFMARRGTDSAVESLKQVLEAAPPQWAKVADDVQRREYLACVQGPDACPKAEDIHALSTRCVGLAMDSMNNTSADWALVLSVINAHSVAIFETHGPFRGPGPASGVPLQALAARLRGALGPPPTPAPPRPWHRVSLADTNNDMFSIQYGYKLLPGSPMLWIYAKITNNTDAPLKNVRVTVGVHGAVHAFFRHTARPQAFYDEEPVPSLDVHCTAFTDCVRSLPPAKTAVVSRCALVTGPHERNAFDVRVDVPRATKAELLGDDSASHDPPVSLYNARMPLALGHALQPYSVPDHFLEYVTLSLSHTSGTEVLYRDQPLRRVREHVTAQLAKQRCLARLQGTAQDHTFHGLYGAALLFGDPQPPVLFSVTGTVLTVSAAQATAAALTPAGTLLLDAGGGRGLRGGEGADEGVQAVLVTFQVRGASRAAVQCVTEHPEWAAWLRELYSLDGSG